MAINKNKRNKKIVINGKFKTLTNRIKRKKRIKTKIKIKIRMNKKIKH